MGKTVLYLKEPPKTSTTRLDAAGAVGSPERKEVAEQFLQELRARRQIILDVFRKITKDSRLEGVAKQRLMFSIVLGDSPTRLKEFLEHLPDDYPELTWCKEKNHLAKMAYEPEMVEPELKKTA